MTHDGLTAWFGSHPPDSNSATVRVLALLSVVLLADGSSSWTHYLHHKVKVLWEFHKIHHLAAFLIPITNRRMHPVHVVFDDTFLLLTVGIWLGLISYAVRMRIADNVVLGMDAYYFANLLPFYHLRHSHIPMSYGWMEHIFLRPAQHHLHHNYMVRHWDRNFVLLGQDGWNVHAVGGAGDGSHRASGSICAQLRHGFSQAVCDANRECHPNDSESCRAERRSGPTRAAGQAREHGAEPRDGGTPRVRRESLRNCQPVEQVW